MSYTPKVEKAAITYEKNVTIDDVVSEADHIFAEFKRRRFRPDDHKALDDFHLEMFEKHKELAQAYPIVLRYMCQLGCYNSKVFRMFIKKIAESPCKGESEYLDIQADYVVMLYKAYNKWDAKTIKGVRAEARKKLQDETDNFKKLLKKYEDDVKIKNQQHDQFNKEDLAQFLEENKDFFANDGNIPIRTNMTDEVVDLDVKLQEELKKYDDGDFKVDEFM